MDKPTLKQFWIWAVLVSLGWLAFLYIRGLAGPFFFFTFLLGVPRDCLRRVVLPREFMWIAVGLTVFVASIVASKLLVPKSVGDAAEHFLAHPAVVVILWLLTLGCSWLAFRRRPAHGT